MRLYGAGLLALLLTACASTSSGLSQWQPVHRFPPQTQAISITPIIEYRVTPLDGTLRLLLARWAYLSGKSLDYRLSSDWALHQSISEVHAVSLEQALSSLSAGYAQQKLQIRLDGQKIIAEQGQ